MARVLLAVLTLALLLTAGNITVIYFWQPNCPGCKYMEEVTFKDAQVQAFLAAVRFEKRDAREVQYVEAYAQRALVVEGASLTFLNGSLTTSGATKIRVVEVDGRGRFPILATPTVVVLEADAGEVYLRGYLLGALPPEQFLSFIKNATSPTPLQPAASSPATAFAIAAALGAASAASPCVIVPLALASTRRRLYVYFLGAATGYAAWAAALALLGAPLVLDKYTAAALIALFGAAYLLGPRAPLWRVQTLFHKLSKGSDFLAGAFSPFLSLPCLLPFLGIAGTLALALLATPLERFLAMFLFGVFHVAAVSAAGAAVQKTRLRRYVTLLLLIGAFLYLLL